MKPIKKAEIILKSVEFSLRFKYDPKIGRIVRTKDKIYDVKINVDTKLVKGDQK